VECGSVTPVTFRSRSSLFSDLSLGTILFSVGSVDRVRVLVMWRGQRIRRLSGNILCEYAFIDFRFSS
jgi:hypothetical protein